ncbi:serine/threonine-protein kinase [Acanthopleuribacter pedis]|uniref:Serine/threonine protein kinase n=1 Tax=Acanthopleuribacter pedis TaxID=442870 RepID=A0A8J7QFW4_9BACT|nr:serine/threonine-protein kinase [Acanthopleuribacter pedis]MBO1319235.1 serine/threonine protein kinase [Acanthopleuribacter pedis]
MTEVPPDHPKETPEPAPLPAQIGPYRPTAKLGEGAVGVVYAAEQNEPVQRRVAVKVIKGGMDSHRVLHRFRQEQQLLAGLNHPYIARIYDSGVTDTDTPFFAMEWIDGSHLTHFCNGNRLSIRDRLALFGKVAEAVAYAHQRGIIHRDLKPANILVTETGSEVIPKIIDFGMAKAVSNTGETPNPQQTRLGAVVGTPAYMSPEQRAGRDTDTRGDLYALGIILYELMLGDLPDATKTASILSNEAFDQDAQTGCAPSITRHFSRLEKKEQQAAAEQRNTTAAAMRRALAGDLDALIRKAMAPDRELRYQSVGLLRDDVRRRERGEPIHIDYGTPLQQGLRLVHRFRVPIAVVSVVVAALVTGTFFSVQGMKRAEAGHRQAVAAADHARTIQNHLSRFLQSAEADDPDATLLTLLTRYSDQLTPQAEPDPFIRAMLHHTVANTFFNLGANDRAAFHAQTALDLRAQHLHPNHRDHLESRRVLGAIYREQGKAKEAAAIHREVASAYETHHGPEDPDTLRALSDLALDLRDLDGAAEAAEIIHRVFETRKRVLGKDHPATLSAMNSVALGLAENGEIDQAKAMLNHIIDLRLAKYGPDHARTLLARYNLGRTLLDEKRLEEALPILEEVHRAQERVIEKTHIRTLRSANALGAAYLMLNRLDDAEPIYLEYLPLARRHYGPENQVTLELTTNHLGLHFKKGRFDQGAILAGTNWSSLKSVLGETHPTTLRALSNYISFLYRGGQFGNASAVLTKELPVVAEKLGDHHAVTQRFARILKKSLDRAGRKTEAESVKQRYRLKI